MHNFYLDDERPEDYVPAAEAPAPIHAILYEEGTRETYVLNGDGRHERLFGIVYREAAETGAARTVKSGIRPANSALRRR